MRRHCRRGRAQPLTAIQKSVRQREWITMSACFEELDYRPTRLGPLCLRRRRHPSLGADIYEIKLGEEFLMSSRFTVSEVALARLGLAELSEKNVDVVVGGLGLGWTMRMCYPCW